MKNTPFDEREILRIQFGALYDRIERLIPGSWEEMQMCDASTGAGLTTPETRCEAIESIGAQFLRLCELTTANDLWTTGGESENLTFFRHYGKVLICKLRCTKFAHQGNN